MGVTRAHGAVPPHLALGERRLAGVFLHEFQRHESVRLGHVEAAQRGGGDDHSGHGEELVVLLLVSRVGVSHSLRVLRYQVLRDLDSEWRPFLAHLDGVVLPPLFFDRFQLASFLICLDLALLPVSQRYYPLRGDLCVPPDLPGNRGFNGLLPIRVSPSPQPSPAGRGSYAMVSSSRPAADAPGQESTAKMVRLPPVSGIHFAHGNTLRGGAQGRNPICG